jgi:hypothetical protein
MDKKLFNPLGFDPCNCFENLGIHWDSNFQSGSSLGSVRVHSLTLSFTLGLLSCLATLQALALVMNPKLGLRHFPTCSSMGYLKPIVLEFYHFLAQG